MERELEQKFRILYSPGQMQSDFDHWVLEAAQVTGYSIGVIFLDVDDFKKFNTEFTESLVDSTIFSELQRLIVDLCLHRGAAYRYGGEELLILLPNCSLDETAIFAQKVCGTIARANFRVQEKTIAMTVSVGVAAWPLHGDTLTSVLERANREERTAKEKGKNRVSIAPAKQDAVRGSRPRFRIINLGTLGGRLSRGSAINNSGHVVGVSSTRDNKPQHAFYHDGVRIHDLGALGPTNSQAHDINDSCVIVGTTTMPASPQRGGPPYRGFVWKQGRMLDLGTLGGNESTAQGVNEAGQIVGQSYKSDGTLVAFMYVQGRMLELPPLNPEKPFAFAAAINAGSVIVGSAMGSDGEYHAVTWEDGHIRDLGTLGGRTSAALDINATGHIVGRSGSLSGKQRAFLYVSGEMVELGSLGNADSSANAINNARVVVGRSWVAPGEHHAFLFIDGNMFDLNDLVDNLGGFTLTEATGVNDRLDIVGSGYLAGEPRAFKLVLREEL
jgi:diguanylate cyclase (GGDEF)-like protein